MTLKHLSANSIEKNPLDESTVFLIAKQASLRFKNCKLELPMTDTFLINQCISIARNAWDKVCKGRFNDFHKMKTCSLKCSELALFSPKLKMLIFKTLFGIKSKFLNI